VIAQRERDFSTACGQIENIAQIELPAAQRLLDDLYDLSLVRVAIFAPGLAVIRLCASALVFTTDARGIAAHLRQK
jgi:hypothetical protein